jgi:hypothetical protein
MFLIFMYLGANATSWGPNVRCDHIQEEGSKQLGPHANGRRDNAPAGKRLASESARALVVGEVDIWAHFSASGND